MDESIRGIACSIDNGSVDELLLLLAEESCEFYASWYMGADNKHTILPATAQNLHLSSAALKDLAKNSIWELVLQLYPIGYNYKAIETYLDFQRSLCQCCLIYYDCGFMEVYIKNPALFELIYNKLQQIQAKDIKFITSSNDKRTCLHL